MYRIAGNFRGAHISQISRMGSNSRTLKSPKLILSLKVGVVYLLARVYLRARMSLLRYLKKGSGSVLPSPGGPLSRHMPSLSIASANHR